MRGGKNVSFDLWNRSERLQKSNPPLKKEPLATGRIENRLQLAILHDNKTKKTNLKKKTKKEEKKKKERKKRCFYPSEILQRVVKGVDTNLFPIQVGQ